MHTIDDAVRWMNIVEITRQDNSFGLEVVYITSQMGLLIVVMVNVFMNTCNNYSIPIIFQLLLPPSLPTAKPTRPLFTDQTTGISAGSSIHIWFKHDRNTKESFVGRLPPCCSNCQHYGQ